MVDTEAAVELKEVEKLDARGELKGDDGVAGAGGDGEVAGECGGKRDGAEEGEG